jgi:hypothetical protein
LQAGTREASLRALMKKVGIEFTPNFFAGRWRTQ